MVFLYKNRENNTPNNLIQYIFSPASNSLRIVNFIFQKIFRVNAKIKYMVHYTSQVSGKIVIGENVAKYLAGSGNCYLQGINGIYIGDGTMIAPGVKIISANHTLDNYKSHDKIQPIKIGNNCWLGCNCIILPGVQLGDNVIVGAGSVVTKSFDSNSIIVGNPAKKIKSHVK